MLMASPVTLASSALTPADWEVLPSNQTDLNLIMRQTQHYRTEDLPINLLIKVPFFVCRLHTTCEMRLCVQIKKGKAVDVQRMNISPDEKLSR